MRLTVKNAGMCLAIAALLSACRADPDAARRAQALQSFATVEQVFQHPRCSNCHIPGDAPLQFDSQTPHMMKVARGPEGDGAAGQPCSSCHGEANAPASFSAHAAPGAPGWRLPTPKRKMAWIGVPAKALCEMIQDRKRNGGRDMDAMLKHVSEDKLVLWGWNPGGLRKPVPVPHDQFVAAFKAWKDAGAPCPN